MGQVQRSFTTLNLMRDIGFKKPEAAITHHEAVYQDSSSYVDYKVYDESLEFREMSEGDKKQFARECIAALSPFETGGGLVVDWEVVYFTGHK